MRRLILAGGGHGHINILKELIKNPIHDIEVILITDFRRQYYSGMLAGFIEGIYSEDDISFDVKSLCARAGVKYIEESIVSIDKDEKLVVTKNAKYHYDIISINLGSLSNINFNIASDDVCLVKPINRVVRAKMEIQSRLDDPNFKKLVFIGGGASGIELALAFKSAFKSLDVYIITSDDILVNFNAKTRQKIKNILIDKDINIITGKNVKEIRDKQIFTNDGVIDFDYAFITTGFRGPDVCFDNFETTEKNYILVSDKLVAAQNSVVMGDTATLTCHLDLPKAGVFAIREAPILYHNLLKIIDGDNQLKSYSPHLKYLQIINCGDKKAIANYGGISFYGKIAWKIKDKIDRDYMKV